jgi:hypothetical protein
MRISHRGHRGGRGCVTFDGGMKILRIRHGEATPLYVVGILSITRCRSNHSRRDGMCPVRRCCIASSGDVSPKGGPYVAIIAGLGAGDAVQQQMLVVQLRDGYSQ